jgi:hypothetical protein
MGIVDLHESERGVAKLELRLLSKTVPITKARL